MLSRLLYQCSALRQVAVDLIVGRGLISDGIEANAAAHQSSVSARSSTHLVCRRKSILPVSHSTATHQAPISAAASGQRQCPAHAAKADRQDPLAGQIAAVMLAARLDKRIIIALHGALKTDVDPRPASHRAYIASPFISRSLK
jgi:hypothetical protein